MNGNYEGPPPIIFSLPGGPMKSGFYFHVKAVKVDSLSMQVVEQMNLISSHIDSPGIEASNDEVTSYGQQRVDGLRSNGWTVLEYAIIKIEAVKVLITPP